MCLIWTCSETIRSWAEKMQQKSKNKIWKNLDQFIFDKTYALRVWVKKRESSKSSIGFVCLNKVKNCGDIWFFILKSLWKIRVSNGRNLWSLWMMLHIVILFFILYLYNSMFSPKSWVLSDLINILYLNKKIRRKCFFECVDLWIICE